jgi:hypothetical protein
VIRGFLYFIIALTLVILSVTVKLGKRTLYGHIKAIWSTPEAKDARDGIKEKTREVLDEDKGDKPDPPKKKAPASKW